MVRALAARGIRMEKPRLSLVQMFNMSFAFLDIQFGGGLQLAKMSVRATRSQKWAHRRSTL